MKNLLVLGAGGHAKVVVDAARSSGRWTVVALLDDNRVLWGRQIEEVKVAGGIDDLRRWRGRADGVLVAVGNNEVRRMLQGTAVEAGFVAATAVHARAAIADSARLGGGTVVMAGAIVNPSAYLGDGVIVNTGATVDHDCGIADWVHIAPGVSLCGEVTVGEAALIGVGAKVLPGVRIGKHCLVAAGAVVTHDLADGERVAGVPARRM